MSKKVTVVRPVISVPATQRKDDIIAAAIAAGFTMHDVERFEKQQQYRKEYNQRPDRVQARKEYMKKRYERTKQLRALLSGK